jgi:hypothetical protein
VKPILIFLALVVASMTVAPLESSAEKPKTEREKHRNNPRLPDGWRVHDVDRPLPPVVTPGTTAVDPPSDAIVLFEGSDLDEWTGTVSTNKNKRYNPEGKALWKIENGYVEITPTGGLVSRKEFGDCHIHLEWSAPVPPQGTSQKRGNSGVFMMGKYEIQILDCYENTSYADGMTAAIYGQRPPLANACRKPGEWQTYDIIFTAPRFDGERLISPAYATVIHNGVVVQNHSPFLGQSTYKKLPVYKAHEEQGPIILQDHNNPVRFRNIWVRTL